VNYAHTDEEVMGAALWAGLQSAQSLDIAGDERSCDAQRRLAPAHRQADDPDLGVHEDGCYRLTGFL
jgi:hypothetical protein